MNLPQSLMWFLFGINLAISLVWVRADNFPWALIYFCAAGINLGSIWASR